MYFILVNELGFGEEGLDIMWYIGDFMANYGDNFCIFKYGVFYGLMIGIIFVLFIIVIIV